MSRLAVEASSRIDCGLTNGKTGDARVSLYLRTAHDVGGADLGYEAVLDTNAGGFVVATWTPEGLTEAAAALGCSPADVRAAVVAAYPEADGWDWAST